MNALYLSVNFQNIKSLASSLSDYNLKTEDIKQIDYNEGKLLSKNCGFNPTYSLNFKETNIPQSKIEEIATELAENGHYVSISVDGKFQKYKTYFSEDIFNKL